MTSSLTPSIELTNATVPEQKLEEALSRLLVQYSLSKWQYADIVRIEADVLPHSHPVLTLSPQTRSTNYLADTKKLLGNYLHEQLHWFLLLEDKAERSREASATFQSLYPDLPTERSEGCGSQASNYLHIQVNYLEYLGLSELLGADEARQVVASIPYYTKIYALVLEQNEQISEVMTTHQLIPEARPPSSKRFVAI